jgi:hypothetical protein
MFLCLFPSVLPVLLSFLFFSLSALSHLLLFFSPFSFCLSLMYSLLNGSWCGCWDEEDDELKMALAVLVRL